MENFSTETTIQAPRATVWATLADFGGIYRWNPGVVKSWSTSDLGEGVGASRHCDLGGRKYLDEDIVEWVPEEKLTVRVTDTNLPFKRADIRFATSSGERLSMSMISRADQLLERRLFPSTSRGTLPPLRSRNPASTATSGSVNFRISIS